MAATGEAAAMAYIAPPLRDALMAGLPRYAECVLADHDEVPERERVPRPDPRNQPAVERMQAGVRMAYWHGGIHKVHSQWCNGEFASAARWRASGRRCRRGSSGRRTTT